MSLGLLGAYDTSGSDSTSDEEEAKPEASVSGGLSNPFKSSGTSAKPSFMVDAKDFSKDKEVQLESASSVFSNPFRAKEMKKQEMLERHVAMTVRQEEKKTIDGKKICWNFRKGRCRFGHKCTFAHDSDINLPKRPSGVKSTPDIAAAPTAGQVPDSEEASVSSDNFSKKKKRPGLSEGIIPSKKAMKFHNNVYGNQ